MAKAINRATIFFNLLLLLSFLLMVSMAHSRILGNKPTLVCIKVYGTERGDTCFSITQKFNLTAELFSSLNPNLECDSLIVGQRLCIEGIFVV